jgi:hypothetical protein
MLGTRSSGRVGDVEAGIQLYVLRPKVGRAIGALPWLGECAKAKPTTPRMLARDLGVVPIHGRGHCVVRYGGRRRSLIASQALYQKHLRNGWPTGSKIASIYSGFVRAHSAERQGGKGPRGFTIAAARHGRQHAALCLCGETGPFRSGARAPRKALPNGTAGLAPEDHAHSCRDLACGLQRDDEGSLAWDLSVARGIGWGVWWLSSCGDRRPSEPPRIHRIVPSEDHIFRADYSRRRGRECVIPMDEQRQLLRPHANAQVRRSWLAGRLL